MSLPIPGIYSVPDNPAIFIYFNGKIDIAGPNWLTYYFLTEYFDRYGQRQYTKTACTIDSGQYDPACLIIPCKSFEEAKHIFTKENYPEFFI